MITSPLLSNVRYRPLITSVSRLLATFIHISPSWWKIYRSFEIILEMGTVNWLDPKQIQCSISRVAKPALCMSRIS